MVVGQAEVKSAVRAVRKCPSFFEIRLSIRNKCLLAKRWSCMSPVGHWHQARERIRKNTKAFADFAPRSGCQVPKPALGLKPKSALVRERELINKPLVGT